MCRLKEAFTFTIMPFEMVLYIRYIGISQKQSIFVPDVGTILEEVQTLQCLELIHGWLKLNQRN